MSGPPLSRTAASHAVADLGWRYLLGNLAASVPVPSLSAAAEVATAAAGAAGDGRCLRIDLRDDRCELWVQPPGGGAAPLTDAEVGVARRVSAAVAALGRSLASATGVDRPVEMLEIAVDAMDIGAVLPFWRAVLAYVDSPPDAIVDPAGLLPAVWFQQMDAPRPQRNRIHLDVTVAHDEADRRVAAALEAGGTLVSDAFARSFWVLADPEGNEACVCTWEDRDERMPVGGELDGAG